MKVDYFLITKLSILITLLVVFGFLFYKNVSTVTGQEKILALFNPAEENLTELYFEDHLKLPKFINQLTEETFRFTIHNLKNKGMNYTIRIHKMTDDNKVLLGTSNAYVANNFYRSFDVTLPPLPNTRTKISVELVNKNQDISFWLDKK